MRDDDPDPGPGASGGSSQTPHPQQPPTSDQTTRSTHGTADEQEPIGPYRILEQIGAGGMGEVYRAEQTNPIRRVVALKVIKRGMDTKEVITRFEAERQALALMDHPCIAKVFEAGSTPRGRPYIAMEYVRGEPITGYCDKQRLTTRERIELFIDLCEGVQHAHQKAIIHRDLKPSNVLVTIQNEKPVPKIIDFGVAKATAQKLTEKTMYTALGELIGTPDYMSPEQAEMTGTDVDTRADVYSLGVILYELLAGALPFDPQELRRAGFEGIIRTIRSQEPRRPSTKVSTLAGRGGEVAEARRTLPDRLERMLRGDLDWITMRALEKDRTRRYGSAAELAADLRRHLNNDPVLASPPSVVYRTQKFVRRHRVGVGIATALTLLLAAFGFTMVVQAGRIAQQRDRASAEAAAATEVTEFLVSSFELVDPRDRRRDEITAREILDLAAERIDNELRNQPLPRARMMAAIGGVYREFDRLERAEELLSGALELRRAEFGERHADTARSMTALARLYLLQKRNVKASELLGKALSIQEELLGNHADTAWTLYHITWIEKEQSKRRDLLERAIPMFEAPGHPGEVKFGGRSNARGAAWCWQDLGIIYIHVQDLTTALECFRRALELEERLLPSDHSDVANHLNGVGYTLVALGDYEGARPFLEKALRIALGTLGPNEWVCASYHHSLGELCIRTGEYDKAKTHLEQAREIYQDVVQHDDVRDPGFELLPGEILNAEAMLAKETARYAEAETLYRRALEVRENTLPPDHFQIAESLEGLADLLHKLGRGGEAERLEDRAQAIRDEVRRRREELQQGAL